MSGLDKNRKRNQTVCFRMTPEERRGLEARITVSGLPKGKYFIQSLLHQEIKIAVGKYQSDRLSLEIRRLWERLDSLETEELYEVLADCRELMKQIIKLQIILVRSNGQQAILKQRYWKMKNKSL